MGNIQCSQLAAMGATMTRTTTVETTGAYLSRDVAGENPGHGYIRVAMVAPTQEMQRGLTLIRDCLYR